MCFTYNSWSLGVSGARRKKKPYKIYFAIAWNPKNKKSKKHGTDSWTAQRKWQRKLIGSKKSKDITKGQLSWNASNYRNSFFLLMEESAMLLFTYCMKNILGVDVFILSKISKRLQDIQYLQKNNNEGCRKNGVR